MKRKEYWRRMGRFGYTKDIVSQMTGVGKSSFYNWVEVPKYMLFALTVLEKQERDHAYTNGCVEVVDKLKEVIGHDG